MTLAEAVDELSSELESTSPPELSATTLRQILRDTAQVKNFSVGAAYRRGQLVAPASANLDTYTGAVFLVVSGGTTTSEPTWPTSSATNAASGSCTFAWFGPANRYDMGEAIREGWKRKMSAAAQLMHSKEGDADQAWQQIFEHCERRWRASGPAVVVG